MKKLIFSLLAMFAVLPAVAYVERKLVNKIRAGIFTVNFNINGATYTSKWNHFYKKGEYIIPIVE